jgi:hypothetical protein
MRCCAGMERLSPQAHLSPHQDTLGGTSSKANRDGWQASEVSLDIEIRYPNVLPLDRNIDRELASGSE